MGYLLVNILVHDLVTISKSDLQVAPIHIARNLLIPW